jgi:hypothetical protein
MTLMPVVRLGLLAAVWLGAAAAALKTADIPPVMPMEDTDGNNGLYVNMLWNIGGANGELTLKVKNANKV